VQIRKRLHDGSNQADRGSDAGRDETAALARDFRVESPKNDASID